MNLAVDFNSPTALRQAGIEALSKELGSVGMALFLRQYENGYGNYTEERNQFLDKIALESIEEEIVTMQKI
jgi:hypothetical protein